MAQAALNIKVYPNPIKAGNALNLEMDIPSSEELVINLVNMSGANVYHNESHVGSGIQTKEINLAGNLKPGIYVLNVIYQGKATSEKIYIQ